MTTAFFSGIPVTIPNEIIKKNETFHISYNPSVGDYGTDTTAIYIAKTSQFLILAGDHKESYKTKSFSECLEYFYANISKAVKQSEHGKIFKITDGKASYIDGGL